MNARRLALDVSRDVFAADGTRQRTAQESLDYHLRKSHLEERDRALATELAYGAIKMRRLLDWYLRAYVGARPKPPPLVIAEILRLASYELLCMRSAQHAVVHEWVSIAHLYGHRGTAGLVNAVLRTMIRDCPPAPAQGDFGDHDDFLGTKYSFPTWVIKQWRGQFGNELLESILKAVNAPAQPAVAVNVARTDVSGALRWFEERRIGARPSSLVDDSLLVDDGAFVRAHETSAGGAWRVHSESAAVPVDVLNPQPGEAILDLCSGRGNKALQAGARLRGEGALTCVEKDDRKVRVLRDRLDDAGIAAAIVTGDATQPLFERAFDRVVLDAPCSGTGVFGRRAEARWRKHPDDGSRLADLQRELLDAAAARVYPGGVLVYAVCSSDPREGLEVVEAFLRRHHFMRGLVPARYASLVSAQGDIMIPPGIEGRDGFFVARLERAA